jgi:hypothetical protein
MKHKKRREIKNGGESEPLAFNKWFLWDRDGERERRVVFENRKEKKEKQYQ